MEQKREFCVYCGGSGTIIRWIVNEPMSTTDYSVAHAVKEKCIRCNGKGYTEYALFTLEEANTILKHCGLSTENK